MTPLFSFLIPGLINCCLLACVRVASHFQCIPSNSTKCVDIAAYFILLAIPAFSFSWLQYC